jgi:hypothetical protein
MTTAPAGPTTGSPSGAAVTAASGERGVCTTPALRTSRTARSARSARPSHRSLIQQLGIANLQGTAVTTLSASASPAATTGYVLETEEGEQPVLGSTMPITVGVRWFVHNTFITSWRGPSSPAKMPIRVDPVPVV